MSYRVDERSTRNYNNRPGNAEPIGICIHHWGVDGQSHDAVADYLASHRPTNPTSAHSVISANRVTELVPWSKRAWHGRSANDYWIGLECRPEMSDGDWKTLVEYCHSIEVYYGKSMRYGRHSDFVDTACPGRYSGRIQELIDAVNALHAGKKPVKKKTPAKKKPTASTSSSKTITRMVDEVIAGEHGKGHANRQRSLGVNNATYAKVRAEVNKRASGGSNSKSIATMATEVIKGQHGKGHANRQRSLGVNNATYAKVRAEVNKRV